MLSFPVPHLTPEIFAPVPIKTLKVWATTLGEEHSSSAFLCLLIFGVPPVVSWGIGSDLLLSQKGRLFCDLGVQDGLMGPKPSGRQSPSTASKTTCKQGSSRPRSPIHGYEEVRGLQGVSLQMATISIGPLCTGNQLSPLQQVRLVFKSKLCCFQ